MGDRSGGPQTSMANPVEDFAHEFATQGALWGPLQGSLFCGDEERAQFALETYGKNFNEQSSRRMF
jgi:hypothetical protein